MDELDKIYAEITVAIGDDPATLLEYLEIHRGYIARLGQLVVEAERGLAVKSRDARQTLRALYPDAPESRISSAVADQVIDEAARLRKCEECQRALNIGFKTLQSKLSFAKTEMQVHR